MIGVSATRTSRRALAGSSRRALAGAALVVAAAGVAGCGSTKHFADAARPPISVNLTVYVDNSHINVSPASVGGGPVVLLITNESSGTQDVSLVRAGGASAEGGASRSSGSINSGATADIQANVTKGVYEIRAGAKILPGRLTVTHERSNSDNALLQP